MIVIPMAPSHEALIPQTPSLRVWGSAQPAEARKIGEHRGSTVSAQFDNRNGISRIAAASRRAGGLNAFPDLCRVRVAGDTEAHFAEVCRCNGRIASPAPLDRQPNSIRGMRPVSIANDQEGAPGDEAPSRPLRQKSLYSYLNYSTTN